MTELLNGSSLNLNAIETGHKRRTLDAIFQHPLAHNLEWREVVSLMESIGSATEKRDGEFLLQAGDQHFSMKKPHGKDVAGAAVMALRHFLTRAGWSPDAPPATDAQNTSPNSIIVIDHAGAKIYQVAISSGGGSGHAIAVEHSKHVLHEVDPKQHDADRDERYPDDERFFEAVVGAIAFGGSIVIIGHGKGQSNEADHLRTYLAKHHKNIAARVVREIVADLPSLTTPELLQLGLHAFG